MKLIGSYLIENVNKMGVVYLKDNILWLEHVCSGVEFEFYGKRIEIEFEVRNVSHNMPWVAVGLDNMINSFEIRDNNRNIVVFDSLNSERITVRIIKRTEKKYNDVGIKSISIEGQIAKVLSRKFLKIGFVGDSISCGYGVEKGSLFHQFSTKYENGMKAFPYILSKTLHADYEIIAFSGIGAWKSHKQFQGDLIEQQYIKAYDLYRLCNDKQLIVINIGTNDSKNIKKKDEEILFANRYQSLILTINKLNPNAMIICMVGPMKCCLSNTIKDICIRMNTIGYNNIHFIRVKRSIFEGIGKGKHPTEKTQQRISQQLYNFYMNIRR